MKFSFSLLNFFGAIFFSSLWIKSASWTIYHMPLSEMSQFLINFNAFFESKCHLELEINEWRKMKKEKQKEKEKELKKCLRQLRVAEIGKYFEGSEPMDTDQNGQNIGHNQNQNTFLNPDKDVPIKANTAMNMMLGKMLLAMIKDTSAWRFFKILKRQPTGNNVFTGEFGQQLANLGPGQNLLVLSELFGKCSMFAEYLDKFVKGKERNKLMILGDKSTLIQLEWYQELGWKFEKAEELVNGLVRKEFAELKNSKWIQEYRDFHIYDGWTEQEEDIAGWKLYPPFINGIFFAEALLEYYHYNKTWKIFNKGEGDSEDFLEGAKRIESIKNWEFGVPEVVVKIHREVEAKVSEIIEKFGLKLHKKEQSRLGILALFRSALQIVQNIANRKIIDEDKSNKLIKKLKDEMENIVKQGLSFRMLSTDDGSDKRANDKNRRRIKMQNIETLKGIEVFYYDEETGERMKKLLREYRSKRVNEEKYESTVEAGIEEVDQDLQGDLVPRFVEAKVTDAVGDILRKGETLAMIDWCHKNRWEMPLMEIAFVVDKLRQFFHLKMTMEEWYEIENGKNPVKGLAPKQILNSIKAVSYQELLDSWNDKSFFMVAGKGTKDFFNKLTKLFDFIVNTHPKLGENTKKVILLMEMLKFGRSVLVKVIEGHTESSDVNVQKLYFDAKYYGGILRQISYKGIPTAITDKMENVFEWAGSEGLWKYFQVETVYENAVNSEVRMRVDIGTKVFGRMVGKFGQFLRENCGRNLWNVEKQDGGNELLANCADRIKNKFGELAKMIGNSREEKGIRLINLLVNTLICEHQSPIPGKWNCSYISDLSNIRIESPINMTGRRKAQHASELASRNVQYPRDLATSVLRGLLQFGRLFMEHFGIFALEQRSIYNILMPWKNIAIWSEDEDRPGDVIEDLHDSLKKGLHQFDTKKMQEIREAVLRPGSVYRWKDLWKWIGLRSISAENRRWTNTLPSSCRPSRWHTKAVVE